MAEAGIDITGEFSKPWTDEFVLAAEVVITMGCGDACPLLPGRHYGDWELDNPAGKTMERVRVIRDGIRDRVAARAGCCRLRSAAWRRWRRRHGPR